MIKPKTILHIDMNSYFASVEQQANPFLRGKAVGVCAYLSPNGCIIASSAEAKAKGIKTGCTVSEAKRLDSQVVLIENEPAKYRSTTEKIFGILGDYTDTLEPYSIDEAFLDLTGWGGANLMVVEDYLQNNLNFFFTAFTKEQKSPPPPTFDKLSTCFIKGGREYPLWPPAVSPLPRGYPLWPPAVSPLPRGSKGKHFPLVRGSTLQGGWGSPFAEAILVAIVIRDRISKEVGEWLGCSIGISWTKFLAKFASDIAPKKGILVIRNETVLNPPYPPLLKGANPKKASLNKGGGRRPEGLCPCIKLGECAVKESDNLRMLFLEAALKDRPLQDAWGINKRMEIRLNLLGIHNLLELKNYSQDNIRRVLGRYGYYLWANVNGIETTSVNKGLPRPKSVGHSYCCVKKTVDKKYLGEVLYKLCEKTGRRLRTQELEAQQMSVGFSYVYAGGIFKNFKTPDRMFTTEEIYQWAGGFLNSAKILLPVRAVYVSVSRLSPLSGQIALFHDNLKLKDLSLAVDKINDKYGEYTVVRGAMFATDNIARDRIGFRKILPTGQNDD
jgi:nucleotidyltransferase/DNA polymerase involved in DNA repair